MPISVATRATVVLPGPLEASVECARCKARSRMYCFGDTPRYRLKPDRRVRSGTPMVLASLPIARFGSLNASIASTALEMTISSTFEVRPRRDTTASCRDPYSAPSAAINSSRNPASDAGLSRTSGFAAAFEKKRASKGRVESLVNELALMMCALRRPSWSNAARALWALTSRVGNETT